jgi:hypothetical protein
VSCKETNESQKHVRTAETRKLRGKATVRRLACSVAWELSFSVFRELRCNCVAFPQFAPLHSVPRVQINLKTILGNCGCVAVASFVGVPSPLELNNNTHISNKTILEYSRCFSNEIGVPLSIQTIYYNRKVSDEYFFLWFI